MSKITNIREFIAHEKFDQELRIALGVVAFNYLAKQSLLYGHELLIDQVNKLLNEDFALTDSDRNEVRRRIKDLIGALSEN